MSDMAFRYWVYAGTFTGMQWLLQAPAVAFGITMSMMAVVPLFWWGNAKLEEYYAESD